MTKKGTKLAKRSSGGRRLRRARRGVAPTHSALATVAVLSVVLMPLAIGNGPNYGSALGYAQSGNWSMAAWAMTNWFSNNWALFLFALIPVFLILKIVKSGSLGRLRLSKHWGL